MTAPSSQKTDSQRPGKPPSREDAIPEMSCSILKADDFSARIEQYWDTPHSAFSLPASSHHWLICQNQAGPRNFLVQTGEVEHDASGLNSQHAIYLPPGTKTQWEFSPAAGSTHLLIPDKLFLKVLSDERAFAMVQEQGPLVGMVMRRLTRSINAFGQHLNLGHDPSDLALSELILGFTEELARELSTPSDEPQTPVPCSRRLGLLKLNILRDYMWDNIDRNITLAELAQQVHLSPFHFSRSFKQETRTTPHQALLRIRVQKARALLPQNQTLTEIAYRCGFSDQAHFTRVFKAHTGFTPKQFRKATNWL